MVWSMAIEPCRSERDVRGDGTPASRGIYRTTTPEDLGAARRGHRPGCPNVGILGPRDRHRSHDTPCVGRLEVDGVRHSGDGGETWTKVNGQIPNQDVHNVLVVAGPPKTVFTVVNDDVWSQHR